MTDVAGLVLSVAALWKVCVQVYSVVDSSRQYGIDSEILSVKFEVERVRLICWGDAVGLQGLLSDSGRAEGTPGGGAAQGGAAQGGIVTAPDPRLQRAEIRTAVLRLLGCIQHAFENTNRLSEQYGLAALGAPSLNVGGPAEAANIPVSQTERILSSVFKRSYENMKRIAGDRQRDTSIGRKTVWAIRDKSKFMALVAELRGFNDSLESLFPDAQAKAVAAMRNDIEAAEAVRELQLLQEATVGENNVVSECASMRLEALGVTVSARTELLTATKSVTDSEATAERAALVEAEEEADRESEAADEETEGMDQGQVGQKAKKQQPREMTEVEKRLHHLEVFVEKKSKGALSTYLIGPTSGLARVSAHVYWDGEKEDATFGPLPWIERDKGYVPITHAAFEMFKKRKYYPKNRRRGEYAGYDSEDYVLLDPEAHPKYEHLNPGTVTVDGFGLECWDYEETKPRQVSIMVNRSDLPVLPARRILRRLHEIQNKSGKFGWNPTAEAFNLIEFVGNLGITYTDKGKHFTRDRDRGISELYSLLNRSDGIFADFMKESSVGLQWAADDDSSIGLWNFLRQIIIGWELTMRLEHMSGDWSYTGFTARILSTLIISDLWLKHIEIILTDAKVPVKGLKKAETAEEKAQAEEFKNKGNHALKKGEFQEAVDLYTEAMKIDLANAVYRCNRAAALLELGQNKEAEEDAFIATHLDPKYVKAWSRLGLAILRQGHCKRAKKAFEKAVQLGGKEASPQARKGLADAEEQLKERVKAINTETNEEYRHRLVSEHMDEDWEILGKTPELHSLIHEQQVEGLLHFAERIKWPYINEVRDYAEDAYSTIRGGGIINVHLHDWLFGVMLPGKWYSFKIMTALIFCTQSIVQRVRIAHYYDCGLALPTRSYWRQRTVLGRVLGCLPNVITLCGWIGPCPPVTIAPPPGSSTSSDRPPVDQTKPRHIRIKTRRVATSQHKPEDGVAYISTSSDRFSATRIRPDEELDPYFADMKDPSHWIIPEPPVRDMSTWTISSITLTPLPLVIDVAQKVAAGESDEIDTENQTEYRASIEFKRDDNAHGITYKLYTNPVFVTPPACHAGPKGTQHEVHMRELHSYQNVWAVERLKDHTPEDDDEQDDNSAVEGKGARVMVINATGKGAEVLARAWCSERGKNAVIRRKGGPCFVCATRAAGRGALGTGVVIWSDE
ncbi:small glutamine-rich tetratricopeptide repeat-containing protein 2 [Cladorrhinum sp. PSN259]|nr:small glutamine-rich tetratricopeptide repeat-containing protein 2 [Cladorrhinum sp. PSN259]